MKRVLNGKDAKKHQMPKKNRTNKRREEIAMLRRNS